MDKTKKRSARTEGSLSWEEREAMIKEYISGNLSKTEIWKKYTGQDAEHGNILTWMRKLGYAEAKDTVEKKKRAALLAKQPFLPSITFW